MNNVSIYYRLNYLQIDSERLQMKKLGNILLSVIIPIKVVESNYFIVERLERMLSFFERRSSVELVIVDSTEKIEIRNRIKEIVKKERNTDFIFSENKEPYSAALARNVGVRNCSGEYVLFFDVDLLSDQNFFDNVLNDINRLKNCSIYSFTIYPCLYLSKNFSKEVESKINLSGYSSIGSILSESLSSCLNGSKSKVLYPAINTSTILVNKEHFLSIGGYKEFFRGHGYEDFFLIHELSYYYPLAKKKKDYYRDYKTDYPGLYLGFRLYFSFYSMENLFKGLYTIHLYHERDRKRNYYSKRDENSDVFQKELGVFSNTISTEDFIKYDDYRYFLKSILKKYGYENQQVRGLYREVKDNNVRTNIHSLYRKLRKLFTSPKKFFSDIRFEKYWK